MSTRKDSPAGQKLLKAIRAILCTFEGDADLPSPAQLLESMTKGDFIKVTIGNPTIKETSKAGNGDLSRPKPVTRTELLKRGKVSVLAFSVRGEKYPKTERYDAGVSIKLQTILILEEEEEDIDFGLTFTDTA